MKILVIGSGGREHAIVWKVAQSKQVQKIYCAPGNGGIAQIAECIDIKDTDISGLLQFAQQNSIDLTIVGPETPISLGIVDLFEKHGLRIFGPRQDAGQLESSKAFSKDFMQKYNIPTAKYAVYETAEKARQEIDSFGYPVVIKADGLAAGKGVIIAESREQALEAIDFTMEDKKFGEAGCRIVVEEFLKGHETSILAFVDGNVVVPMVSAQDHKRAFDGDLGPNTGGMGAVSPALYYNDEIAKLTKTQILDKTLAALKAEGITYKGVLFVGLMLTADGPKVLEYNARFGDPETEVVLPRLKTDLIEIMNAVIDGRLNEMNIEWSQDNALCVVMASGGYPEHYEKGYKIEGLDKAAEAIVFHAGTKLKDGDTVTAGGRVLIVTALGKDTAEARKKAYESVEKINFKDAHYRKDIAQI